MCTMLSMNRVLRWDGIIVQKYKGEPGQQADPEDIKAIREFVEKTPWFLQPVRYC